MQRTFNSSQPPMDPPNIARDGAPKKTQTEIPIKPGMRRQTPDSFYTGPGQSMMDDEKELPLKNHLRPVGHHSGMTDAQIVKVVNNPTAGQILDEASRLGKPKA